MFFKNSRRQDLKQFFVSLITAFTKTDIKLHLIYCWKKASMNMKVFCLYGAAVIPRVGMLRMVTRINRDKNEIILFWGCKPMKIKIKIYHKAWPIILVLLTIIFILSGKESGEAVAWRYSRKRCSYFKSHSKALVPESPFLHEFQAGGL